MSPHVATAQRRWTESELITHVLSLDPGPKKDLALQYLSKSLAKRAIARLLMLAEPMEESESITCFCIDCITQLPPIRLNKVNQGDN